MKTKTNTKVVHILLAVFASIILNINSNDWCYTFANTFTILSGCYFFFINHTQYALGYGRWNEFLYKNIVPFLVLYTTSILFYTLYLTNLSNVSFEFKHLFRTSYPYRSNGILPILYFTGMIVGILKRNRKALKVALVSVGFCIVIILCSFALKNFLTDENIDGAFFIDGKYSSIEEIIQLPQFQTKTVYIDLWYSTCTPCIDQMKNHVPKLKRELKNSNLDIEYLYLGKETSHLNSKQKWLQAINKYQLKGYHYYFKKSEESSFWETLVPELKRKGKKTFGYPQYLIAKNGQIVEYDAPYPELHSNLKEILLSK